MSSTVPIFSPLGSFTEVPMTFLARIAVVCPVAVGMGLAPFLREVQEEQGIGSGVPCRQVGFVISAASLAEQGETNGGDHDAQNTSRSSCGSGRCRRRKRTDRGRP